MRQVYPYYSTIFFYPEINKISNYRSCLSIRSDSHYYPLWISPLDRLHRRKFNLSSFARYFVFPFFFFSIFLFYLTFLSTWNSMVAAVFIPFDSFNFHLPRDVFYVRFHSKAKKKKEERDRKNVEGERKKERREGETGNKKRTRWIVKYSNPVTTGKIIRT